MSTSALSGEETPFPQSDVSAVLLLTTRTRINAPASLVFDILSDTATWPLWNTYVPRTERLERLSDASILPTSEMEAVNSHDEKKSRIKQGDQIKFFASLPGQTPSSYCRPA